ncbi:MAG: DUF4124 domain-containing protein [Betaproteobacteria bacterium]
MKTSLLLSLPLAAALLAAPVHAQVFKCKGPSGVVYQDGPCESGAAVDTRSPSGVKGTRNSSQSGGGGGSGAISTKPTHPVLPEKMRR